MSISSQALNQSCFLAELERLGMQDASCCGWLRTFLTDEGCEIGWLKETQGQRKESGRQVGIRLAGSAFLTLIGCRGSERPARQIVALTRLPLFGPRPCSCSLSGVGPVLPRACQPHFDPDSWQRPSGRHPSQNNNNFRPKRPGLIFSSCVRIFQSCWVEFSDDPCPNLLCGTPPDSPQGLRVHSAIFVGTSQISRGALATPAEGQSCLIGFCT
jgi:hypothetical protein